MNLVRACVCEWMLACSGASAQPVSLKGKSVTMIVGFPAGGRTDLSGPLIASLRGRHCPASRWSSPRTCLARWLRLRPGSSQTDMTMKAFFGSGGRI
jgi:hypothetical protein